MPSEARLSSIEGNRQLLDGGAMFGNVPRPMWEKWLPPDSLGRIPLACRALLIEYQGQRLLCETGIGAFFDPKMAERFGVQEPSRHLLRENLAAHGVQESDIDFVVLSHLHFDHAGGLLPTFAEQQSGKKDLLFPRAKYLVGQEAWDRAIKPHSRDRASFIPGLTEQLAQSGRLLIIKGSHAPGVWEDRLSFFVSQGHTPGQLHSIFRGDQTSVVFCGDLIPGRAWVHLPITMGYDRNPELLIDEKARLYERALPQDWLLFFTHDPEVAAGRLSRDEKGKFSAKAELKHLESFAI